MNPELMQLYLAATKARQAGTSVTDIDKALKGRGAPSFQALIAMAMGQTGKDAALTAVGGAMDAVPFVDLKSKFPAIGAATDRITAMNPTAAGILQLEGQAPAEMLAGKGMSEIAKVASPFVKGAFRWLPNKFATQAADRVVKEGAAARVSALAAKADAEAARATAKMTDEAAQLAHPDRAAARTARYKTLGEQAETAKLERRLLEQRVEAQELRLKLMREEASKATAAGHPPMLPKGLLTEEVSPLIKRRRKGLLS